MSEPIVNLPATRPRVIEVSVYVKDEYCEACNMLYSAITDCLYNLCPCDYSLTKHKVMMLSKDEVLPVFMVYANRNQLLFSSSGSSIKSFKEFLLELDKLNFK